MIATSGDCPVGRLRNVSGLNPSAPTDTHVHTIPHLTQLADVILHTEDCDYNRSGGAAGERPLKSSASEASPARSSTRQLHWGEERKTENEIF